MKIPLPRFARHTAKALPISAALLVAAIPANAVPVFDALSYSQLISTVTTLARQVQQLTQIQNNLTGLTELIGLEEQVAWFKQNLAQKLKLSINRFTPKLNHFAPPLPQFQVRIEGATMRPASTAVLVQANPGNRPTANLRTFDEARNYAIDHLFIEADATDRSRVVAQAQRTFELRNTITQMSAIDAWASSIATQSAVEEQSEASAMAGALGDAGSLREDIAVLTGAVLESNRTLLMLNHLAAQDLRIGALNTIQNAPVTIDADTHRALQGNLSVE